MNSLVLGRLELNFRKVIFKLFFFFFLIYGWVISCEIVLRWLPLVLTNEKSTLDQLMACCQTTSNYLSQFWPRFMLSLGHNELNLVKVTSKRAPWPCNPSKGQPSVLTGVVLKPEYSGRTWSIPWLLMPWLLVLPGSWQPWYWLCGINGSVSFTGRDFNDLRCLNIEWW